MWCTKQKKSPANAINDFSHNYAEEEKKVKKFMNDQCVTEMIKDLMLICAIKMNFRGSLKIE